jgi:hypothetical protein
VGPTAGLDDVEKRKFVTLVELTPVALRKFGSLSNDNNLNKKFCVLKKTEPIFIPTEFYFIFSGSNM